MKRSRIVPAVLAGAAVACVAWWGLRDTSVRPAVDEPSPTPTASDGGESAPVPGLVASADVPESDREHEIVGWVYRGGRPLDATITVTPPHDAPTYTVAATAAEGFRLSQIAAGTHTLRTGDIQKKVVVDRKHVEITLVLPDGPHAVRVRLLDAQRKPLRLPVTIDFHGERGPFRPDEDGRFVVPRLHAGGLRLFVHPAPDAKFMSPIFGVPRTEEYEFVVPAAAWKLDVHTFDARTKAPVVLDGLYASVERPDGSAWNVRATPPATARLSYDLPSGRWSFSTRKKGYGLLRHKGVDPAEPFALALRAHTVVRGQVVDHATGEPVEGVPVHVFDVDLRGRASELGYLTEDTLSARDGTFEYVAERPLTNAMVLAFGNGWASHGLAALQQGSVNPFVISEVAVGVEDLKLPVTPAGRVRVRVVNEDGTAAVGLLIAATQRKWWLTERMALRGNPLSPRERVGEDGVVAFDALVPGWEYRFAPTRYARATVVEGDEAVRVAPGKNPERTLVVRREPVEKRPTPTEPAPRGPLTVEVVDERGRPVRGAQIDLRKVQGNHVVPPRNVRTGADGRAIFHGLPGVPMRVRVRCFQFLKANVDIPDAAPRVRVELDPGLMIRGVAQLPDGTRVTSGTVSAQGARGFGQRGRWEPDGHFRIGPLTAGRYELRISKIHEGEAYRAKTWVEAGDESVSVTLKPREGPKHAAMRLRGADGVVVKNAMALHVQIGRNGRPFTSMYGVYDGVYSTGPARSRTWIDIVRPAPGSTGRSPLGAVRLGPFEKGDTLPAEVVLPRERVIAGRILDARGGGVGGVRVQAFGVPPGGGKRENHTWAHEEVWSASDGAYRIGRLGDLRYDLRIHAPRHLLGAVVLDVAPGTSRDIVLQPAIEARVRVLDDKGRGVSGAYVYARSSEALLYRGLHEDDLPENAGTTDGEGWVTLLQLDASRTYRLIASPPSDLSLRPRVIEDWSPRETTVQLEAPAVLAGVVRDVHGEPLAKVAIRAEGSADPRQSYAVTTKADGSFRLAKLPAGTAKLTLTVPGLPEPVTRTLSAPDDEAHITVDTGGRLKVEVELPAGAVGFRVTTVAFAPDGSERTVWPTRNVWADHVAVHGLAKDGACAVYVTAGSDDKRFAAHVTGVPVARGTLRVELRPARSVRVRVQAPPDVLRRRPHIEIAQEGVRVRGRVDRDGRGGWNTLPEGRFRVRGSVTIDGVTWRGSVQVDARAPGSEGEAALVLRPE